MLIKVILVFLAAMAVLAMFGRLRLPGKQAAFCPGCGRPRIGKGPCPCGKKE
jgi:hypothetical protein